MAHVEADAPPLVLPPDELALLKRLLAALSDCTTAGEVRRALCPLRDRELVSALLRECVTVVRPGEVIAVRIDPDDGFTPSQMREIAEVLGHAAGDAGVRAMLVLGHEMAVAQPVPAGEPS